MRAYGLTVVSVDPLACLLALLRCRSRCSLDWGYLLVSESFGFDGLAELESLTVGVSIAAYSGIWAVLNFLGSFNLGIQP
jgi:hypothetical protein